MKSEHLCANHPDIEAVSVCHHCRDWFCLRCLREGPEHYFCEKPECLSALDDAISLKRGKCPACGWNVLEGAAFCPSCGKQLRELTPSEMAEDLVTVTRFGVAVMAQLARTKLESEGIESYIFDENMGILYQGPGYNAAFGGFRLQVKKSDEAKAALILEKDERDSSLDGE